MPKDTKSLDNNKAPACESRGFVHKKKEGVHFDTPSSGERKCLRLSLHNIQQFIGDGLLATLVVLMRQCLQQFVGIVAGDLHSDHAGGMFSGRGIKQCRIERELEPSG